MKQHLYPKIFNLAANLLGYGEVPEQRKVQNTLAKEVASIAEPDKRILSVYPAIIDQAFASTMDNYRIYISGYNFKTNAENDLIEKFNTKVKAFRKTEVLTEVQTEYSRLFVKNYSKLKPREYNTKVDEFVNDDGMIVLKRKIQTVKYATEIIFQNFLHLYNAQLMKRNEQYIRLGITTPRPIQEFKINSFLVTQLKRKDILSLDLCTKTIRNHRQRLEECGVFVDYHFSGQNRPVEVHINDAILTVLDLKNSKLATSENQALTSLGGNVLPDNNENTRTSLNKSKMKENVDNISQDIRSSLPLTPSHLFFTGTPASNVENSPEAGAEDNVKVLETLSEKLQNIILHPQELAVSLANKDYNNYKPIDIRILYKEAYSGTMLKEDFRELVMQDFFKSISKIYKNSTPYAGSWKKAISIYYQYKWISFTNESFNKAIIVEEIQEMRWRTKWAVSWFLKNKFTPLFPSEYFDMTRKTSKEVGYEYTKIKFKESQLAAEKYKALRKKQEANAILRKETINHAKKFETEINRFFKNRITLPQLFDYVQNNLPYAFLQKLPEAIEKKSLKINQKSSYVEDYAKFNLYDF